MKRLFIVLSVLAAILAGGAQVNAQSRKEKMAEMKERIKYQRELRKEKLKGATEKASKMSRNAAKDYEKQGWKAAPGKMPIAKQLDNSFIYENELDDYGSNLYIAGTAKSVSTNYDAAKMQAMQLARIDIANNMEADIYGIVENNIGVATKGPGRNVGTVETVSTIKNEIASKMGRVITAVELYREPNSYETEVMLIIYYNAQDARNIANEAIEAELKAKADKLSKKVDEMREKNKQNNK